MTIYMILEEQGSDPDYPINFLHKNKIALKMTD